MSWKVVVFIVFIWVIGAFMGAILAEGFPTGTSNDVNLDDLTNGPFVSQAIAGGAVSLMVPNPRFFQAIYKAATFQFDFLTGGWGIVKWIVFVPLAVGIIYGLVLTFINTLWKTY